VLSLVRPVRIGWRIEDLIVIRERIRERRWKREKTELIYISKNYYVRPERPVHQRLRARRRLTVTLDATSAGCHVRTPFPIYPWVLDVPRPSPTKRMHPDALRPYGLTHSDDLLPVPPSS